MKDILAKGKLKKLAENNFKKEYKTKIKQTAK